MSNNVITFPKKARPRPAAPKGTVLYRTSKGVLRDEGDRMSVDGGLKDRAFLVQSLREAVARYGTTVKVTGSAEFREAVARVTAEEGMDVHFSDEALENRCQAIRRELAQRAKALPQTVPQPADAAPEGESTEFTRKDALIATAFFGGLFALLWLFFDWSVALRTTLFVGGLLVLWGVGLAFGWPVVLGLLAVSPFVYIFFAAGETGRTLIYMLLFIIFLFAGGWVLLLGAFLVMGVLQLIESITGLPLTGPVFQWGAILAAPVLIGLILIKVGNKAGGEEVASQPLTPEEQQARAIQTELAATRRAMESLRRWTIWRTIIGR